MFNLEKQKFILVLATGCLAVMIMVGVLGINVLLHQEQVRVEVNVESADLVKAVLAPSDDMDKLYIKVTRLREEMIIEEEVIEQPILRQADSRLLEGKERVVETGEPGLKHHEVQVVYHNGVEVSRQVVASEVVLEPKQQVVVYGTAKPQQTNVVASRGNANNLQGEDLRQVLAAANNVKQMESTAYTHTGNPTFTGIMPYVGVVAVDPKVIPLGTKMYIEGYGFGLAADTGGAIKGDIVDVFMDTRQEALKWGRRQVTVHILD